jgi:VanZ family protein
LSGVLLPGLRYPRFWMLCGFGIVFGILSLCLLPSDDVPQVNVSDKLEHVAAFVLLAFWFGSIVSRRAYLRLALALVAYGALIEVLQGTMHLGREPELLDIVADAAGIMPGLLLALTPLGRWAFWLESLQRQTAP